MKKWLSIIALIMVLALSVSCFVSCKPDNGDSDQVTVSWYQGSKLLKEQKVDKGSKVASWEPTAENKTFTGWYAEASLAQPFDFDAAINEDTDIFAAFKSDDHVEDENSYYLIGAGAGDMGKANWDHTNAEANLTMTKENVEKANVYTITITMYAGDMFQICYGGSWNGQVGIGLVEGAEYCDGVNFNDNNTYTAADKKVAQVKNAAGEVVFIGSDEYNNGFETWNIKLADGMDGKYKFTYTTYPNAGSYNTISYELVEKIEPMTSTNDMYIIGTHNEWSTDFDKTSPYRLVESTDKATWTGSFVVTEEMYADWTETDPANTLGVKCAAIKIFNKVNSGYYSPDGNNIFLTAGTYSIKYTVEGNVVEIAKCDYYLVGTFVDASGAAVNFSVKEGVTPALTVEDGVATCTLVATDVTAMGDFSWIADQGKPGVFAFKVVYGSELGIATWYSDNANGGDNWYVAAGEYTVTFNIEDQTVTIVPVA
ncbi:MAG: InlB B-repeat-containing protein [Clostridia bacterium]|nr:InlB B-repeat-containing protein [Clostridia bacterium]